MAFKLSLSEAGGAVDRGRMGKGILRYLPKANHLELGARAPGSQVIHHSSSTVYMAGAGRRHGVLTGPCSFLSLQKATEEQDSFTHSLPVLSQQLFSHFS